MFIIQQSLKMPNSSGFRVIIAGGGVAGLTLANCLQNAEIDYLLLEARNTATPEVGASIGMFANGSRILDQLGVYEGFLEHTQPSEYMSYWYQGKLLAKKDVPQLLRARYALHLFCLRPALICA